MHKDFDGNELEKGFYLDIMDGDAYFFSGEYSGGNALVSVNFSEGILCAPSVTENWRRISNPKGYLTKKRENLNWAEQKLSQLERDAKEANLSAHEDEGHSKRAERDLPGLIRKGIDSIPGGKEPYNPQMGDED